MGQHKKNEFKESLHHDTNIKKQQQVLEQKTWTLVDNYLDTNTFENREYLCYLSAAIYLTYKEFYPDLSIYIPFRIKSDQSFIKNLNKEFLNNINLLTPEEFDDLENSFNTNKIVGDINAATIVLDHIKTCRRKNLSYSNETIQQLIEQRSKNITYTDKLEAELQDNFIDEETYFNIKMELLRRLKEATYPTFTLERTIPYSTELENVETLYKEKLNSFNFSSTITNQEREELDLLLYDLRTRLSDKLEYEILRETLPNVLNSPLIKTGLKVQNTFVKDSQKPNGFAALYYQLETPFGLVELQSQPNKRYYEAKKGSAFHSGIKGKELNIDSFFELTDPNDKNPLDFYLKKLNSIPVDSLISDFEIPKLETLQEKSNFMKTPAGIKYIQSQKIKALRSHVKLKDTITIDDTRSISTDEYLFGLAKFVSPYMNVCSSGHTSFSTASIHQKNLVGEFSEILRRRDSITCLGDILVERLKNIVKDKKISDPFYFKTTSISSNLPREISRSDLIDYAEKLQKSTSKNTKENRSSIEDIEK